MKAVILKNALTKCNTVQELLDWMAEHEVPTTARVDYQDCGSHDIVVWWSDDPEYRPWWDIELDATETDELKVVEGGGGHA